MDSSNSILYLPTTITKKEINMFSLKQFDSIIFHFTTIEFFLYIHSIVMLLLVLWTAIGIYYMYKCYKKGE